VNEQNRVVQESITTADKCKKACDDKADIKCYGYEFIDDTESKCTLITNQQTLKGGG